KTFHWTFNGILLMITSVNAFWFFKLKSMMTAQSWNLGIIFIFIPLAIIALIFNLPHKPKVYPFLSKLIKVYILFAILLLVLWQKFYIETYAPCTYSAGDKIPPETGTSAISGSDRPADGRHPL